MSDDRNQVCGNSARISILEERVSILVTCLEEMIQKMKDRDTLEAASKSDSVYSEPMVLERFSFGWTDWRGFIHS
jgi:hypothetical protein